MTKPDDVHEVFTRYQHYHPQAVLGAKRRTLIQRRLDDGYTVEQLHAAIDGCHRSEFHSGDNPRGKKYQSLELILRDEDHVEQFIDESKTIIEAPTNLAAHRKRRRTYGI